MDPGLSKYKTAENISAVKGKRRRKRNSYFPLQKRSR
jgi:hypothetical protein